MYFIHLDIFLCCLRKFGESRWANAVFVNIILQAIVAIIFESIIFDYHSNAVDIIRVQRLDRPEFGESLVTAYANARSLLVYFVLFIFAQIFTVILVFDAASGRLKKNFLL